MITAIYVASAQLFLHYVVGQSLGRLNGRFYRCPNGHMRAWNYKDELAGFRIFLSCRENDELDIVFHSPSTLFIYISSTKAKINLPMFDVFQYEHSQLLQKAKTYVLFS
jgi:hypothetical protein